MNDIVQAEDLEQFEVNDLYKATQLLLQEFQQSKEEEHPGKIKELSDHLKKRLMNKAAYPLAVLLECGHLAIRHQLQKDWNSPMKQRQLFLFENLMAQFRGKVPPEVWNQICLAYAEALLPTGRSIDALAVLDDMAEKEGEPFYERQNAERGWALVMYSTFLRDQFEKAQGLHTARDLLRQAQQDISDERGRALYGQRLQLAERMLEKLGAVDVTEGYTLNLFEGKQKQYREWCAEHRLLLNGANDIDPAKASKIETFRYRPAGDDKEQAEFLESFLKSLMQEFTALRWTLFEALEDSEVSAEGGYDRTEQLKSVYRHAFSLFDKIALFLNHAYKLEVDLPRTSMQRIWFEEEHPKKPLKPFIKDTKNDALKALYWLSKELFGYERSDRQSLPMIRATQLRHQLERSFVQVVESPEAAVKTGELRKHQMTQKELERMAVTLTFKARTALMYLRYAVDLKAK
ncbi:LA2681 family HEPN domain-containing protein [Planococcus salinus]|uniref:LA2681 family HEPN domain-containing protein n=1 Tax=Planococcus salinus TaxID=1848460 RepID=UPI001F02F383|nr:LA2681 family HEPN domain-containing protein [Planococcus salinus]